MPNSQFSFKMACPECGKPISFLLDEREISDQDKIMAGIMGMEVPISFCGNLRCESCDTILFGCFSIGKAKL
jgi:hypothetical protein